MLADMPLLTHRTPFAPSTHAPAAPGAVLSRAALQQYAASGYLAIPDLCSAGDLAQIRATLVEFFRRRVGRDEGSQFDGPVVSDVVDAPRRQTGCGIWLAAGP